MFERRKEPSWSVHPGEILKEEFLKPMKLSGYALAKALGVNAQRVSDVVLRKTGISADMALLLSQYFGTTPQFWMNLQASYELHQAGKSLKKQIKKIKPRASAA